VGGGNGLKADAGLLKIVATIIPTTQSPISVRIERASQTENFMQLPAFPRGFPKKNGANFSIAKIQNVSRKVRTL
jgi:hypothetical protein